jgi:cysteine desulfurase
MSRFVLDCAVSRPPDEQAGGWLATAARRAWAPPTGGYHEAKTSHALLVESQNAVVSLTGAAGAWFTADPAAAVAHAVLDLAVSDRFDVVVTGAADSVVLQEQSQAAASQLGLPHHVAQVDGRARLMAAALPQRALLVTAAANQEIGSVQADLGDWVTGSGSAVVLDATCAFGWTGLPSWWQRLVLDPRAWGGPAGAVAVASRRPGRPRVSDNVPAAVVAGLTGQRWAAAAPADRERTRAQVVRIRQRVLAEVPDVEVHGGEPGDLPHLLSLSVLYVDAEALQTRLDARGFAVGSGSACASRTGQPSHVLAAIGGLTSGNVRLGLPPGLPDETPDAFVDAFIEVVGQVRAEMGTADL